VLHFSGFLNYYQQKWGVSGFAFVQRERFRRDIERMKTFMAVLNLQSKEMRACILSDNSYLEIGYVTLSALLQIAGKMNGKVLAEITL
jgi:hypothetical protein